MTGYPNDQRNPGAATPGFLTAPNSALCISGAPQILKAGPGSIIRVNVLVAGSAPGGVYDCATTAAMSATANEVAAIPNFTGQIVLEFPCLVGIGVAPGTGQTISASYA